MKRVRQESHGTSCSRNVPAGDKIETGGAGPSPSPDVASNQASTTERQDKGGQPVDGPTATTTRRFPTASSGGEDDLRTIDRLLEEAIGSGRNSPKGLENATETMMARKCPRAEHGESRHEGGTPSDATLHFRRSP